MLAFVPKFTRIVRIDAPANNVNLSTLLGSRPPFAITVLCFINAALGSTASATPAFQTGANWYGSTIFVYQNADINGKNGANGLNGLGGAPGVGGSGYLGQGGQGNGNGTNGSQGGHATAGEDGSTAVLVDTTAKVRWTAPGRTIRGGTPGNGATGGGGGGGGGGGAVSVSYFGRNAGRGAGRDGPAAGPNEAGGLFSQGSRSILISPGVAAICNYSCGSGAPGGGLGQWGGNSTGAFDQADQYGQPPGADGLGGPPGNNSAAGTQGKAIVGYNRITFTTAPSLFGGVTA